MSAMHTPGPWLQASHDPQLVHAPDASGYSRFYLRVQGLFAPTSELEATARLIVVAPDMLEALIKIVKYADSEPDGGETVAMHRANIERARAVIAKATGSM